MKFELLKGDITTLEVDIIVNAANSSLLGGGGVDGAIHRAGGPSILKECKEIVDEQGNCPTGEAVITNAGNLKALKVIHTVGPVWKGGQFKEAQALANCYYNSLKLAEIAEVSSIAFPNISTGVYGYPKQQAAEVAVKTVYGFVFNHVKKVVFVCYDDQNYNIYSSLLFP